MAAVTLQATPRSEHGKGVARKLRAAGRIPAVIYGRGDRTEPVSLDAMEFERLLSQVAPGTTVLSLDLGGKAADVLIRDLQYHPFKPQVLHVDFLLLHAGETLELAVPVRLTGTPVGVHTEGGVLDHVLYEVQVRCLPRHIPEAADVDVSALHVGDQLRVRDIALPDAEILTDGDLVVATVLAPRVSDAAEGGEAAPADAGGAEGA